MVVATEDEGEGECVAGEVIARILVPRAGSSLESWVVPPL